MEAAVRDWEAPASLAESLPASAAGLVDASLGGPTCHCSALRANIHPGLEAGGTLISTPVTVTSLLPLSLEVSTLFEMDLRHSLPAEDELIREWRKSSGTAGIGMEAGPDRLQPEVDAFQAIRLSMRAPA